MRSGKMVKTVGYGEDSLTLWVLKQRLHDILSVFQDKPAPFNCLVFYRPSFGRRSRKGSSIFGEFDAILVSSKNVYLIESKWDNLGQSKGRLILRREQKLRHQIFSWYLTHWDKKYSGHWDNFVEKHKDDFKKNFKSDRKTMPQNGKLLATNLEYVLMKSVEYCRTITNHNIKNVLLFFHSNKKRPKPKVEIRGVFTMIPIDYSEEVEGNFVTLFEEEDAR
jgi:hypothetical protein